MKKKQPPFQMTVEFFKREYETGYESVGLTLSGVIPELDAKSGFELVVDGPIPLAELLSKLSAGKASIANDLAEKLKEKRDRANVLLVELNPMNAEEG
ncbi:MAG: hypothetical protein GY871_04590 [Actinomycetales bacterium]|nr:hypothetical protein [Actinomycetales bacterium]